MTLSAPIHQLKRRARLLSRRERIPLHAALDRIATDEGYRSWSLLVAIRSRAAWRGIRSLRLSSLALRFS